MFFTAWRKIEALTLCISTASVIPRRGQTIQHKTSNLANVLQEASPMERYRANSNFEWVPPACYRSEFAGRDTRNRNEP